ncbi:MAG TPA: PhnA domain-containing protein [Ohtaekwangia sp.]|uniref:PhnA domain-containing protein n=1 Tax=Ohtaekwangia sp. TaxID=2066019 RepID=UPI002F92F7AE
MSIDAGLFARSEGKCELCEHSENLQMYLVSSTRSDIENKIVVCNTCFDQLHGTSAMDSNHWRCLTSSMWSTVPAVQVVAWRMLNKLLSEGWPQDLLDMLYLDDDTLAWAKEGAPSQDEIADAVVHKDSNGNILQQGDTVVLIKDLDVKGGGFTAKRGTAVRNIALVENNPNQIEGRVNGQQIVILTQYTKKST